MFKFIRSKVSKVFSETQQMKITVMLSQFFWYLRKYFLGVEIDYPTDFLKNYELIKKKLFFRQRTKFYFVSINKNT